MVEFMALVITLAVFGVVGVITWMCCKLSDKIYDKKAEKALKKYPDFYALVDYVRGVDRQKSKLVCEVYDLKKDINSKVATLVYLIKDDKMALEEEIEKLRQQLKELDEKIRPLEEESKELWHRVEAWQKEIENNGGKIY